MWLQKFTEYFVNRPTIFWSLMAAIIIAGIISFSMMPKLEDPAICAKQANVVAIYPGASAHEVELKLVKPSKTGCGPCRMSRKYVPKCQPEWL